MNADKDISIIRELGKQYAEAAAEPANAERKQRARDINSLRPKRPIVWIDEIPWHEMDIGDELSLLCQDEILRGVEQQLRRSLYKWRHMQADTVLESYYYVEKAFDTTEIGVEAKETTLIIDKRNNVMSHSYEDLLDSDEKVDQLQIPVITARPDIDARRLERVSEALYGILPVKLRGHGIYYAPWDTISRLRGVEALLTDLTERPELMHKTISRFTDILNAQYNQMEVQGLLDYNISALHCTPPYVDGMPAEDYDGGRVRFKDIWFRGMSQIFGSVSPAMHDEFELQYSRKLMDQCAFTYYGCCEPLDNKIYLLKKIPNMRKIGVSPWANVRASAEAMGGDYVFARKPNPAFVAGRFDKDTVQKETREVIEACMANNCPYEFVLKDISTVSYRPQNLFEWADVVERTIDEYY